MRSPVWSISALVGYLKNSLENDMVIQSILVKGEISNFTHHKSGHIYFNLKDGNAMMPCVMFSSNARKLKIIPKEGMKVIVHAKVSLYESRGSIQLYISNMQSDGLGDLYLQFEELKRRLHAEGLFSVEHKKQLPQFPMNIGVISAKTGAAIQDVLSIIARRWPLCDVKVYPSLVQGEFASLDLIKNLKEADQYNHDVILLVRGGGSIEDLWCFNDEMLARTIYDMKTCVISGVGHETDTTLVDYVSDHRAPTPSAAAELVTPDYQELIRIFNAYENRLKASMDMKMRNAKIVLKSYEDKQIFKNPEYLLQNAQMRLAFAMQNLEKYDNKIVEMRRNLDFNKEKIIKFANIITLENKHKVDQLETLLNTQISNLHNANKNKLIQNVALLDAFSPLKVLQRGYSIVMHDKKAIKSIEDISLKDKVSIVLNDGTLLAEVLERKNKNEE